MEKGELQNILDDLLIVLVIYKMKISESQAYSSLTESLVSENNSAAFFIYDNSLEPQQILSDSNQIYYAHDPSNQGVSKAYNQGFVRAKETNKKWLLLADQDTTFSKDLFLKLCKSISNHPHSKLFAPIVYSNAKIISPFRFILGRGWRFAKVKTQVYSLQKVNFINSGLVISLDLFEKCNGYDERFPLDFSDLVFANRILKFQDELVVIDAPCVQKLSSEGNSRDQMLERVSVFLKASRLYGETFGGSFFHAAYRFYRTWKMSFRFNTFKFLNLFFKN